MWASEAARQLVKPRPLAPVRCVVVGAGPACASVRKPDATFCVRVRVASCEAEAEAEVSRTLPCCWSLFLSTRSAGKKKKGGLIFFSFRVYFYRLFTTRLVSRWLSVIPCARLKPETRTR